MEVLVCMTPVGEDASEERFTNTVVLMDALICRTVMQRKYIN